jgi:Bifunctional DNA primase/polymerase, N-terminal
MSAPARPVAAPSVLQAALGYLEHGWSIVPAPIAGKRALIPWKRWQTNRPSPQLWRAWAERWPRANIALVAGALSGVVVLDIDPRHGGDRSLAQLEAEHGELPTTTVVITPSGGRHAYFAHPGGRIANSQGLLGPGLDVRGDGGLALLPPSRRQDGTRYEWWQDPDALAPLPGWMEASCRPPRATEHASSSVATTRLDDARTTARFDAILRILHNTPEGGRNTATYWCALRVRDLIAEGAPRTLAVDLEEAAVARGLPRAEAKRTVLSGLGAEVRP